MRIDLDAIEAKFRLQGLEEDADVVGERTAIVRKVDEVFEHAGGSSRPWVRDCFLSVLDASEFALDLAATLRTLIARCRRLEAVADAARMLNDSDWDSVDPDLWEAIDSALDALDEEDADATT